MKTNFTTRTLSSFTAVLCTTGLIGCSSLSHKFDADRAKQIKRVAVVAIEIHQQRPADNLGLGKIKELSEGQSSQNDGFQTMTQKTAEYFILQLRRQSRWEVLSVDQVKNHPAYKQTVAQYMSGARTVMIGAENSERIYMNNFLDIMAFRKMSVSERDQLAKALGVDAIAELMISQSMKQSMFSLGHISGDGAFSLIARANLQLFGLNSEEPVWRSQNVDGEMSRNSDDLPEKMSKTARLAALGEEASMSAVSKVVETLPR